jgi:23S rRNA (cytosine1962-C5)-methyltransferase
MANIVLKSGRERSILLHHPWIFSGAIDRVIGDPGMGDTVEVFDHDKTWLARAAYSPLSQIRARIWTWSQPEQINGEFFFKRIQRAFEIRSELTKQTNSFRLVHGESDDLPGVVIDFYGSNLVIQILSAGVERWKNCIVDAACQVTNATGVYERSDVDVRRLEGLEEHTGLIRGELENPFELIENGIHFLVDLEKGQKTGFYLDQRNNRQRIIDYAKGRRVLNCFSYSGGFSLYALAAGAAEVVSVDSSAEALELARENMRLNQFSEDRVSWVEADVFQYLRLLRDRAEKFDLIVLDPPKFAPTASQAERAARGYKDINLLAFKLLTPGGVLFTFSCSGGISADLFQKIVAGAALDAGIHARILERLHPGVDHPIALSFPEGEYLKGLICTI